MEQTIIIVLIIVSTPSLVINLLVCHFHVLSIVLSSWVELMTVTFFCHFQNEYSQTLETVGKVLSSFEQDKKIPAYGFGAQASSNGPLPYVFALNSETGQVELEDIDVSVLKFCGLVSDLFVCIFTVIVIIHPIFVNLRSQLTGSRYS